MQKPVPVIPVDTAAARAHRITLVFFGIIAAIVLYFGWRIIVPYSTPIILAAVIATFSFPAYKRMTEWIGGRKHLGAGLMCLLVTLVIVVPAVFLLLLFVQEAIDVLRRATPEQIGPVLDALRLDTLQDWMRSIAPGLPIDRLDLEGAIFEFATILPGKIAEYSAMIFAGIFDLLLGFALMMLTLYYFYVDGERIVAGMKYLSPLPDTYDEEIFDRFRAIVNATLKGSLIIGIAQGATVSVGFAIAGVTGAAFWGVITVLASFLPMIGAGLVWVPAVIYLSVAASLGIAGAAWWQAIFLALWGTLVVSLIDNFLRPYVMRGDVKIPAIVLFFSILGGLHVFGFLGILLGPLVFALIVTIAHIYRFYFRDVLQSQNEQPTSRQRTLRKT